MNHANYEKQKKTKTGRNRTVKLRKNRNAQRNKNQQILGNI